MRQIEIKQFVVTNKDTSPLIADEVRKENLDRNRSRVSGRVAKILSLVRTGGDEALLKFANEFDDSNFKSASDLFVSKGEFELAYSKVRTQDVASLKKSFHQIRWLANKQMQRFGKRNFLSQLGFKISERYVPFERIGGYVPGGLASYPSTVLMICAPALEAGVREIVLVTPAPGGVVNPSVLVAADICGVKEIIKLGGAQAIGALAFGTNSVRSVRLIAGPGNEYVTEAKRQVSSEGRVSIDSLAGPTEILIVADSSANPKFVFEDLVSQAEHGNGTLCGLVSDSPNLIRAVIDLSKNLDNRARVEEILEANIFSVRVSNLRQAVDFAQALSPEHIEVMTSKGLEKELTRCGLVLAGKFAPCSASDYIVGTNHILPTGGDASRRAGLSVETFLKRVTVVRGSKRSLNRSCGFISNLASLEELPNHGQAALTRFEDKD